MKKIISIGILFLVLIAFSGAASAIYVTDQRTHYDPICKLPEYGKDTRQITSSNVVHYSNYIVFHYRETSKVRKYGTSYWRTTWVNDFYKSYKKPSYNKIRESWVWKINGISYQNVKGGSGSKVITTLHSPYYVFKMETGTRKSVDRGIVVHFNPL